MQTSIAIQYIKDKLSCAWMYLTSGKKCGDLRGVSLDTMKADNWEFGPVTNGINYSIGMLANPLQRADGTWSIEFTDPSHEAHYVTIPCASLVGMSRIKMTYRVEANPGVQIVPVKDPTAPSLLTLYFQRKYDDWTAQGKYETYRWFASFSTQTPIRPGEYTIEAEFNQNWTAILTSSRQTNPAAYNDALANAGVVGFVLGGGDGLGHGVKATGSARIIVTSFIVQ